MFDVSSWEFCPTYLLCPGFNSLIFWQGTQRGGRAFTVATSTCCSLLPGEHPACMLFSLKTIIIIIMLSWLCDWPQAWVETEYGQHHSLNAGGSRTAESSMFSYEDISLSDAGGENRQESTYLYIQMEYCPRCVSFCSYVLKEIVQWFASFFDLYLVKKLIMLEVWGVSS
jgi:hypothetical protein